MNYKGYVLRAFFVGEILLFSGVYFFGAQGLHSVWRMQHENGRAKHACALLQEEVTSLEQQLYAWQHHPFHKEKLAREQLQMARPGEQIYYIG